MTRVTNAELKQIITTNASTTNTNFQKAKQAISGKVDKVTGKGLSTNDFTDALQTKLNGIATGADVSTIKGVQVNATDLTPDANGKVNVQIPSAVSYTIAEAATTTSGMLKTYILKADGVEVSGSKINIPKDYLLKSASIETCATANTPISGLKVGDPYLDLVFNTKDSSTSTGNTHQYVNLAGLVDVYTAGTGISISNANAISIDTTVVALKTDIPTVPTNVSSFTNDAGYLTSHQDVSDKCDADDVRDIISAVIGDLSITAWDDITVS